jgi:hypothetical protein
MRTGRGCIHFVDALRRRVEIGGVSAAPPDAEASVPAPGKCRSTASGAVPASRLPRTSPPILPDDADVRQHRDAGELPPGDRRVEVHDVHAPEGKSSVRLGPIAKCSIERLAGLTPRRPEVEDRDLPGNGAKWGDFACSNDVQDVPPWGWWRDTASSCRARGGRAGRC